MWWLFFCPPLVFIQRHEAQSCHTGLPKIRVNKRKEKKRGREQKCLCCTTEERPLLTAQRSAQWRTPAALGTVPCGTQADRGEQTSCTNWNLRNECQLAPHPKPQNTNLPPSSYCTRATKLPVHSTVTKRTFYLQS